MAENDIVFKHYTILIRPVGDDFPAAPMTEKTTDFRLCQRERRERSPGACIDTGNALKSNSDPRKFHRDSRKAIDCPIKIDHVTLHLSPRTA
ncbi:conserved hypothetical protein [Mesorhizobium opportunistum WSM2075]|uniref:Uncharacterized protein n=1 Tax=Mesorhizobium opportunistum (strain LMG 24607 / HAMBI 3007 / WSM2075) TaxID=536019 RepID=F7YCK1_MESOW|nr:conserved hypothetical protein [Mesorhizobium opportunistum WSM2075]